MHLTLNITISGIIATGTFVVCVCFLYISYRSKNTSRIEKYVDKLPGLGKIPIVGTSYVLLFVPRKDLFGFMKRRLDLYYGMFRSWIGSKPNVHLGRAEHAEIILNNSIQINKSSSYDYIKPWLGEGLLISSGQKWQSHRKLLTPAFHFKILDNALETFDSKARFLIKQLSEIPEGIVFDMYPFITHCTLDIICETAMGVQLNSMSNQNKEYVDAVYAVTHIGLQRMVKPWLQPDIIFKYTKRGKRFQECLTILHDFTINVIIERRLILNNLQSTNEDKQASGNEFQTNAKKTFLDILLEASKSGMILKDEEIREEVDTFLFEGHDTTTAAICWCLFLLGNHLDIQEKVYNEIADALKDHEGPISMEVAGKLKLLERCIKEALRLYPSVPVVSRLLQKDVEIDGFLIPTGCAVNLFIYAIHRSPRYYDNPLEFNPDRFLPENNQRKHPYAYIPFSAGPRNCIGQKYAILEEKVLLAHILSKFKIRSAESEEQIRPVMDLILRPLNGLKVVLEHRKSK